MIDMYFNSIEEYDKEIKDIENKIKKYEKYVENHPERLGMKGNISTLKYIKDVLINDRNQLSICKNEEINFHISGDLIKNHSIPSSVLIEIINSFEDLIINLEGSIRFGPKKIKERLDNTFKEELGFNIKPFSEGSFVITFSPKTSSDNQTMFYPSLNKKSFEKLCEIINLNDNYNKVLEQSEIIGFSSIIKYKDFINIISKNKLDVKIYDNMWDKSEVSINHVNAKNIYESLKNIEFDNIKTTDMQVSGQLYYINSDTKQCGIKIKDETSNKIKKLTINFNEEFKLEIKDKLYSNIKVDLKKNTEYDYDGEIIKERYELINIE